MAGFSQSQTLSQQQVLAPQLQQSLQILQAPMLELRNLIQQERSSCGMLDQALLVGMRASKRAASVTKQF